MSEVEFRFLTVDDVLELHDMQLESYGGATGIRAPDLGDIRNKYGAENIKTKKTLFLSAYS